MIEEPIVLASGSPRRQELLKQVGIPFIVDVSEVSEEMESDDPAAVVATLSERKARAVAERHPGSWVLGADTVVYYDGEILGKPADEQEAFDMLSMLGGRRHEVLTGVTLLRLDSSSNFLQFVERTTVTMKELPRDILKWYVSTGEPMDKAGAYGIQGKGAVLVEKIEGDYNNVVGLPVSRVFQKLLEWE